MTSKCERRREKRVETRSKTRRNVEQSLDAEERRAVRDGLTMRRRNLCNDLVCGVCTAGRAKVCVGRCSRGSDCTQKPPPTHSTRADGHQSRPGLALVAGPNPRPSIVCPPAREKERRRKRTAPAQLLSSRALVVTHSSVTVRFLHHEMVWGRGVTLLKHAHRQPCGCHDHRSNNKEAAQGPPPHGTTDDSEAQRNHLMCLGDVSCFLARQSCFFYRGDCSGA